MTGLSAAGEPSLRGSSSPPPNIVTAAASLLSPTPGQATTEKATTADNRTPSKQPERARIVVRAIRARVCVVALLGSFATVG